jgi:hypothetical protein
MQRLMRFGLAGSLIALGYLIGSSQIFQAASAQNSDAAVSEESAKRVFEANEALKKAASQLILDSRYSSATKSVNSYAVLAGGIDVKEALESGQGVDPDTWAALNVAIYELKKSRVKDDSLSDWVDTNLFDFDNNGHLTYRNKIVRIYSISKLRKLNAQRSLVLGETKEQKSSR